MLKLVTRPSKLFCSILLLVFEFPT